MNSELRLTEAEFENMEEGQKWKGNVIIFPGGGYQWHSPREAGPVAKAFASAGWKPWILYYPVASQESASPRTVPRESTPLGLAPLRHAAAAVKKVRENFPGLPVVLCGFSAGAHAAATLGVHWNDETVFLREEQSLIRPDAMILSYPVITVGDWAHRESIAMLAGTEPGLGKAFAPDAGYFSLERHVTSQTPPTFLWHTASDESVPVQNSILFAGSLAASGVPFELRIYNRGVHGLSLATKEVEEPEKGRYADPRVAVWFDECVGWLEQSFSCWRKC